jgi:NAD(P)-dependent dehydrogenase (short-subunit alcohol dehydrogenase family)
VRDGVRKRGDPLDLARRDPYPLTAEGPAWNKTFEVNLKGYFCSAREVARHCIARQVPGSMMSIASVDGPIAASLQGMRCLQFQ